MEDWIECTNWGYNYEFADLREAIIYYRNAFGEMETIHTTTKHQYWFVGLKLV